MCPVRTPWFYCPELRTGEVALDARESHHAQHVLRLRPGDAVALFDGRGTLGEATLTDSSAATSSRGRAVRVAVRVDRISSTPPPRAPFTLVTAGCKGERADWLIEKCTELGVSAIITANFERSIVRPDAAAAEKALQRAVAACKQCGRARLPVLRSGLPLPDALATALNETQPPTLLIADPAAGASPLGQWLARAQPLTGGLIVVIGPEGGLTDAERAWLSDAGGLRVTLGPHILRVETAAVAAAAAWAAAGCC